VKYGRKPKLTDSTIRDITAALSIGATIEIACAYAGVSSSSYYNWINAGKEALEKFDADPKIKLTEIEKKYLRFYDEIEKTKAYAAIGWLQVVNDAANHDPSYALRMLKIRYPDGFKETSSGELDVTSGGEKIKGYTVLANPDQWPSETDDDDSD
jgi:hypothetical protein